MLDVLELQWKLTQARNENPENRTNWYSSGLDELDFSLKRLLAMIPEQRYQHRKKREEGYGILVMLGTLEAIAIHHAAFICQRGQSATKKL